LAFNVGCLFEPRRREEKPVELGTTASCWQKPGIFAASATFEVFSIVLRAAFRNVGSTCGWKDNGSLSLVTGETD
jgi:hypothetical protein